jgi:hypothetical protein
MAEVKRIAIIDKDWNNKLVSVVESTVVPWTYWLVITNADWTKVWSTARGEITGTLSNQTDLQLALDDLEANAIAYAVALGN